MGTSASKAKSKSKAPTKVKPSQKHRTVDFKIHIAVDFGTDGCGLAFAYKHDTDQSHTITVYNKWSAPKAKSNAKAKAKKKTKTQLILNEKNGVTAFGNNANYIYCNMTKEGQRGQRFFSRFKMALYENDLSRSQVITINDDEKKRDEVQTAQYLYASNQSKVESEVVFVAVFKELQKLAKEYIPGKITSKKIRDEEIQWILTVPAIWSESAKEKMREWIIKAELVNPEIIDQCIIVYEPDSASLSIQMAYLKDLKFKGNKQVNGKMKGFQTGDKYILVDAGGGTVDVACHKILEGGCVEEIFYPTGDKWGSCYIDDLYVKLLEQIFSKRWIDAFKQQAPADFVQLMNNFQDAKEMFFKKKSNEPHRVMLPDDFTGFLEQECDKIDTTPEKLVNKFAQGKRVKYFRTLFTGKKLGQESERCVLRLVKVKEEDSSASDDDSEDSDDEYEYTEFLEIDCKIWKCLFDSKINPIICHVKKLLTYNSLNDCTFLGLVGGFSCSKYFQYRMEQHFGRNSNHKLTMIIPKKPMLCVVEGAAWMAITQDYIRARKLKHTYGQSVALSKSHAQKIGISNDYIQKHIEKDGCVEKCFMVIAKKNERIAIGEEKKVTTYRRSKSSRMDILYSDKKNPKILDDGTVLATLSIEYPDDKKELITEFHFYGTMFKVYVYPQSDPNSKQEVNIKYIK